MHWHVSCVAVKTYIFITEWLDLLSVMRKWLWLRLHGLEYPNYDWVSCFCVWACKYHIQISETRINPRFWETWFCYLRYSEKTQDNVVHIHLTSVSDSCWLSEWMVGWEYSPGILFKCWLISGVSIQWRRQFRTNEAGINRVCGQQPQMRKEKEKEINIGQGSYKMANVAEQESTAAVSTPQWSTSYL